MSTSTTIVTAAAAAASGNYGTTSLRQMVGRLNILIGDTENRLGVHLKTAMLNEAQDRMILATPRHVIAQLDTSATDKSLDSDGIFDLSTLSTKPFGGANGIDGVQITDGKYATKLSWQEWQGIVNRDKDNEYSSVNPAYYIRGVNLYFKPTDTDTIDIYYQREPDSMTWASVAGSDTNCEFRGALAMIILGLACKDFIDKMPQAARAFAEAMAALEMIGETYTATDSIEKAQELLYDDSNWVFKLSHYSPTA